MKGMALFAGMSDVRDSLIEESLMLFDTPAEELCPKGQSAFSRFLNSGWGVAMICAVISLGVLMGIIRAGQNPPVGAPGGSDTTQRYEETADVTDTTEETEKESVKFNTSDNWYDGGVVGGNPTVPTPNIPSTPNPSPNLPGFSWEEPRPETPSVPRPNVPTPGPTPMP